MALVRLVWKWRLVLLDTHTWCGLGGNAPIAGTELPGYPPFKKEKNITSWQTVHKKQSVWIVRLRCAIRLAPVSVLRHTMWNAVVWWILLCHDQMGSPFADSYHSLNSVFCAEHFYCVSCSHVIFPACLNCVSTQLCSMLGDIDDLWTFGTVLALELFEAACNSRNNDQFSVKLYLCNRETYCWSLFLELHAASNSSSTKTVRRLWLQLATFWLNPS